MSSNDEEIKVSLTADYANLEQGMDAGAASVSEGSQTMADAIAESSSSITRSYEEIIAAQNRNMAQTTASIAAEDAAATARSGAAGAIQAETVATTENTAAMAINGGVARELGVLIGELARGNYTRLEGSTITLANRTGLLQAAFSPLGAAIGGAALAIGGFAYEVLKGEEQTENFNKALVNSGNFLNITEGQFNGMALAIRSSETTIGSAREALMDLANTGRISGDNLETAGKAAVDFASLTGDSMTKAVAAVVKLQEDPVKAILALNAQYHFLTEAQLDHIEALEKEGDATGAATAAIQIFQQVQTERLAKVDEDVGTAIAAWRSLKATISDVGDAIQSVGRKQSAESQEEYANLMKAQYESLARRESSAGDTNSAMQDQNAAAAWGVAADKWKTVVLQQKATLNEQNNTQKTNDAAIAAGEQVAADLKMAKGADTYKDAVDKLMASLKTLHSTNADDSKLKGITFDSDGDASGGPMLAELQTALKKRYDLKQKGAQDEKKLDDQQLAQEEADQSVGYSDRLQFEMAFWQKKLETATQGTKEYAEVYAKVQNLEKQYDEQSAAAADKAAKEKLKSALAALDQEKAAYDGDAETQKKMYQTQYDLGQISANQLAELEKELVQKKLAADIAYLTAKENLDRAAVNSGADAANKEAADIVKIRQKADQDMQTIDDQAIKNSEKAWNSYASAIGNSMKSAVTGMLFQGEKFKSAFASIGQSMVGTFVDKTVNNMVSHWAIGEGDKTGATGAGESARLALQAAGAKDGMTISAAMNEKSIANAAYTGAANAYQALAGIPIIGPVLGAAAAVATFAGIEAYDNIASAAGGWGDIPSDQLAMVHKNEMILPANIAQGVREMTSGGGNGGQQGGGDIHVHLNVQALDGRTTGQYFRRNMETIASVVATKVRNMPQFRR